MASPLHVLTVLILVHDHDKAIFALVHLLAHDIALIPQRDNIENHVSIITQSDPALR